MVSTAIGEDNPELARARERGQPVLHRGELLAELCAEKRLIAVAGTHGKTTTAGMLVWALRAAGADPAFFLGGELPGAGADGGRRRTPAGASGEWVVAEADESDASFLRLRPEVAVVTNVEMDHHSRWALAGRAARGLPRSSARRRGAWRCRRTGAWPGWSGGSGSRPSTRAARARSLELAVPGRHNLLDARAASGRAGAGRARRSSRRRGALADFPGVRRRLELKGTRNGAAIYDDYAHHPTEVAAALEALRELGPRRLIAVFQPHLYSRTKALAERVRRGAGAGRRGRRARRLSGPRGAGRAARRASAAWRSREAAADRAGGAAGLVAGRRRAEPSAPWRRGSARATSW